jgi:hypothetical protein
VRRDERVIFLEREVAAHEPDRNFAAMMIQASQSVPFG